MTATDSTSNGTNGTISSTNYGAGVIGGGASLNGNYTYIDMGANVAALHPSTVTLSCWFTATSTQQAGYASPVTQDFSSPRGAPFSSYDVTVGYGNNSLVAGAYAGIVSSSPTGTGGTSLSANVPYLLAMSYDGSTLKSYVNGALANSTYQSGSLQYDSTGRFRIGANSANGEIPTGIVEEVHVSNLARPANWMAAEYNNQSSPSSFYAMGAEVGTSAPKTSGGGFFRLM